MEQNMEFEQHLEHLFKWDPQNLQSNNNNNSINILPCLQF